MVKADVVITNATGLHMRPARELCKKALEFESVITVHAKEKIVDAKSVLGLLSACIKENESITVQCEGEDEESALAEIVNFINQGLGE